jgi:uncharacterized protein (DUF2141 family)
MPRLTTFAAVLLLGCGALASTSRAADLTVTFRGIKTPTGAVMVSLAGSEDAYDGKAPAAGQAVAPVKGDEAIATFKDLAPGRYAIKAFHDVNGDGKMSQNPFGMPTEPFAFSNNAHGSMGPAKWTDASFDVTSAGTAQTIEID